MTAKSQVEYVVPVNGALPLTGQYFASPSGHTVLLVTRVSRVIGAQARECVRIYALRLRKPELPPDVTVLPWPAEKRGHGRPSRAAEAPTPTDRPPIQTQQQRQQAERKRLIALRRSYSEPENKLAEPIRVANRTLVTAEIRDPDDNNPNHRVPLVVKTFRNFTVIDNLLHTGTITKSQRHAANIFRGQVEKARGLGLGQSDLGAPRAVSGSPPVGITEMQMFALDAVRGVKGLLNGLYPLVEAVVVNDITLRDCAVKMGLRPAGAAGRLVGALEVLAGHYSPPEAPETSRETIGAQLGPANPR
jgi:hypothetical protein